MSDRIKAINGWTRKEMVECLKKYVPDGGSGALRLTGIMPRYSNESGTRRCAVTAFYKKEIKPPGDPFNQPFSFYNEGPSNRDVYDELRINGPLPIDKLGKLERLHDLMVHRRMPNVRQACIKWVEAAVVA